MQCILSAQQIYSYRRQTIDSISQILPELTVGILRDAFPITISYESKVARDDIVGSMKAYLEKNRERDILLQRTPIGPHVDDFSLQANGESLTGFASR